MRKCGGGRNLPRRATRIPYRTSTECQADLRRAVTRSRRLLLVLLAVGLIAAATAAVLAFAVDGGESGSGGTAGGVREGGPLADPDNASAISAPVPLGKPYSWGLTALTNAGDEVATIERIELLDIPDGMRVIGVYALDSSGSGIGIGKDYEPDGRPDFPGLRIGPTRVTTSSSDSRSRSRAATPFPPLASTTVSASSAIRRS